MAETAAFMVAPLPRISTRSTSPLMQLDPDAVSETPADQNEMQVNGISPVLGGGKSSGDIEKSDLAVNGSKAAFAIVFAALIYGGVNEDQVAAIAKSQYKCVPGKIVGGKKTVCKDAAPEASIVSAFPDVA